MEASTKRTQQPATTVGDQTKIDRRRRARDRGPAINDTSACWDWEAVEQWTVGVLERARQAAAATAGPDSVRGILYVTHCFADELATANPRFDRPTFVTAVTSGPS
jgi:hypothetical protein